MTNPSSEPSDKTDRIIKLELDIDPTRRISSAREHERAVAIFDLLDDNEFKLLKASGPYHLYLRSDQRHIHFDIRDKTDAVLVNFFMALGPLRRIMRDYFLVCDSYYEAHKFKPLIWDVVHFMMRDLNYCKHAWQIMPSSTMRLLDVFSRLFVC